jgi:hypothetical protein
MYFGDQKVNFHCMEIAVHKKLFVKARGKLKLRTRLYAFRRRARVRTRIRAALKKRRQRAELSYKDRIISDPGGAIVTLTDYFNYGNIAQRYALQRFLQKKGYNFISYAQECFDVSHERFDRLRNTIPFVQQRIARKKFSPHDDFSIYITGSDQVWRRWGGGKEADLLNKVKYYFFDFLEGRDVKRIAYSASFGHDDIKKAGLTDEFMESVRPLVDRMDAISMREAQGVALVKKWWHKEAVLTLDPTMLLGSKDYSRLIDASTCPLVDSKPIFAYILDSSERRRFDLEKIFSSYDKPSETIYLKESSLLPPVEQWMKNIRDAELVITDSFHGMVFSIINNTSFYVLINDLGGAARIESLLSELGLKNRVLYDNKISEFDSGELDEIDWEVVNQRVDVLRRHSEDWLLRSIKE